MARLNQVRTEEQYTAGRSLDGDSYKKIRLNLNDLLKKRNEEKKVDRKVNLAILSGATAITAVIVVILGL